MNKTWNVLGIIGAWILSIALVLMLFVTPLVFSALSLMNADTITKAVSGALMVVGNAASQPSAETYEVTRLSEVSAPENPAENTLAGMFGDQLTQEQMDKILSSKLVKDFIKNYTEDLTNAFIDGAEGQSFNAEKVKSIVNDNLDEIVGILQEVVPECANMDKEELKSSIQKAVDEGAEKIVQALPKPQDIRQEIAQQNPALETALKILAQKDKIKLAVIGAIILISALIFLCRLPEFRGLRWLAVDLFVGAGFGAFVSVGLVVSSSAVSEIAKQSGEQLAGIVGALLSDFTSGMFTRTAVMLIAGGLLLATYIFIKKQKAAAQQAVEAPAVEAPADQEQA
ncbi:MAG: hypothetical protein IJN31_01770 [Peptococcaceae bacterium]|nr:hypothetical protein [Oscillospiraceae bacterium]MBQ7025310.1 hypothetical protein [Peptococcaceae bacterium]